MASYQSTSALASNKISKPRSKAVVKPILKKLSHSEKNSLDLDRGWEEEIHIGSHGWGPGRPSGHKGADSLYGGGARGAFYDSGVAGRSARDVSFSLSATDLHSGGGGGVGRKFTHARSTSGTSHISVATTGSGHHGSRNGTFVHPHQQTPRTSTPPLSYATSLASLDNNNTRDYSPTITEDDDDNIDPQGYHRAYYPGGAYASSLRRPSLASQRSNSLSDISAPPQLRISTASRSNTGPATRLAQLSSSRSDLQLNTVFSSLDSPASTSATITGAQPLTSPSLISPSSSVAPPMSPIRSSLEMGFRLRSRSEVDTLTHREQVRQARERFEEKERAKEEKYAREQGRRRDRTNSKDTQKFEKLQRKAVPGTASGRNSMSTDTRTAGTSSVQGHGPLDAPTHEPEKVGFASNSYENVPPAQTPRAGEVSFESPRRMHTAKRKTASAWTSFILWLRTRLLKIGRR